MAHQLHIDEIEQWVMNDEGLYNEMLAEVEDPNDEAAISRYINKNRHELNTAIQRKLGKDSEPAVDNDEIELWINNDPGLYQWARGEISRYGGETEDQYWDSNEGDWTDAGIAKFIEEHRDELTKTINRASGNSGEEDMGSRPSSSSGSAWMGRARGYGESALTARQFVNKLLDS